MMKSILSDYPCGYPVPQVKPPAVLVPWTRNGGKMGPDATTSIT